MLRFVVVHRQGVELTGSAVWSLVAHCPSPFQTLPDVGNGWRLRRDYGRASREFRTGVARRLSGDLVGPVHSSGAHGSSGGGASISASVTGQVGGTASGG